MPDARFARQVALAGFGVVGQRRLGSAHVVVVGAGGLGSAVLPVLAAAGVGSLTVVDDDVVEVSNLPRQTLYTVGDVGGGKADLAVRRLTALGARATAVRARVDAGNAAGILSGADVVVDATDDLEARYALDDAAAVAGVPLVWGSATAYDGQVGVAHPDGPRWRDLFPVPPLPADAPTCAVSGVLPSLCTTVGGAMATEVLKLLAGIGRPLIGRMLVFDALEGGVRAIDYGAADTSQGGSGGRTMAGIEEISPAETAERLQQDPDTVLVDVREPWEAAIASLPGSTLIPLGELADRVDELPAGRPVIAYCHGGVRSLRAAEVVRRSGRTVVSMAGGIDAWSRTVDPAVPRY